MTTALNRFFSGRQTGVDHFFKWRRFQWIRECNVAFEKLKEYLSHPPILSRPEKEEVFLPTMQLHVTWLV